MQPQEESWEGAAEEHPGSGRILGWEGLTQWWELNFFAAFGMTPRWHLLSRIALQEQAGGHLLWV